MTRRPQLFAFGLLAVSTGCVTIGPKYERPTAPQPETDQFKEARALGPAAPKDDSIRADFWQIFADPRLNELEQQVDTANQSIAASYASFKAARAMVRQAEAQLWPSLSLAPTATAQNGPAGPSAAGGRTSVSGRFNQYSLPVTASWAPDLWGRIENTLSQSVANAQVSAADLENQRLLQHAELAVYYFELQGQDQLQAIFNSTVEAYRQTLELTKALAKTGIDSDEAVAQAETQLEAAEAQAIDLGIARAQYEHAIATLLGRPASAFSLPPRPLNAQPPMVPLTVPSRLLERRPDIAAAERAVAAANAQIGVAETAYYPTLNLSASAGWGAASLAGLTQLPLFFWSVGATLSETLFDAGLRGAVVEQARAQYEATVASYRQTVLTAFQQVEDDLAGLRLVADELKQQRAAVVSAQRYLTIATNRYRLGLDPYLDVIAAQSTLLQAQRSEATLAMQEMTLSVQLIEALGGGWNDKQLPSRDELTKGDGSVLKQRPEGEGASTH